MNRTVIGTLIDTLAAAGQATVVCHGAGGETILVLPYGGRVLGLFAPGSDENFLWTHPALDHADSARAFYASSDWHNSGGDRSWLAPEVDFFLPNFPRLDMYVQPRAFDPGQYQITREDGVVTLKNHFACRLSRSGETVDLELTKRICGVRDPLRSQASGSFIGLVYAGYSVRTLLAFTSGQCEPSMVGLWSLLQMPHDGELLIPTFSKATINKYFGQVGAEDLIVTDHLVRYRLRAKGEHKIGLEAPVVTGRAGYLRRRGDHSSLVIRNFCVDPSGSYIDVPWGDPDSQGAAIEACNVNSHLGCFAELEYHAPAIGGSSGKWCCEDESQVWAYRGPEETMVQVSRLLLSPES